MVVRGIGGIVRVGVLCRLVLCDDGVVDSFKHFGADALAKVDHHGGVEEVFLKVFAQAKKVLEVGIFADLCDSFFIGEGEAFFDDEGPQCDSATECGGSHAAVCKM